MMLPIVNKHSFDGDINYKPPRKFPIGPFKKYKHNPIMKPDPNIEFECAYLYNATAIVIDDKVFMLYRAQNREKVSSVGIAWSNDGINFTKYKKPIIYSTESYEQGGGIEDPRIVRDPKSKLFVVTYTAFDLKTARLCVAYSEDLFHWIKKGPIVPSNWNDIAITTNGNKIIRNDWSKSGAIFNEPSIDNKYYMIWGDCELHLAESENLLDWKLTSKNYNENTWARQILDRESKLIESGPAPIKMQNGNQWIFFYNAATTGGNDLPKDTYTINEMLINYDNILNGPVARLEHPILKPELENEITGQVNQVVISN
ncbi:unnamed protein product [Candida verbasci]|uniref:Glycosyl hydrolase n=1 Tax=Candida verbasci TaxID=1227364 RepID=A0A9W4TTZ2_9ASCO|nr:unnamed protein product [Candida verbasci]